MAVTERIPPRARRALRLLAWRARRPLAAVCAALAVVSVVERVRPPDPPTVEVPVAARDLEAGAVLRPQDVRLQPVPPALVPRDGPRRSGDVTGRPLLVAVPQGLPIVPELLTDETAVPPEGTVVVPVRFADAGVAALLRPGVLVDVVAAPVREGDEPERLARGAVVLAPAGSGAGDAPGTAAADSPGPAADRGGGLLGTSAADGPVLLAVGPEDALGLGASASSRVLGAVIVG
ncbi:SAF domain-containing protein [Cellulomonas sp. C5510]|uniref:SAF domain-containing protein n=1 Tax=Cellulomonas sp. C5510 TaxID=2871170 RepID=UPI001C955F68|nr:SAF domain-containing protein [Cellulomonas sp. C5510]QZN86285.1 flagellar biosynthesis protein FlgA [Cellulomonas sp. C5510]